METADVVDGELVTVDHPGDVTLFGTGNPHEFLTRVRTVADALADVIRQQNLAVRIRGSEYVRVEGWTCLGSLLGVFAETEWTRPVDGGWEARVVAHTRAGEPVGAAESMCTRSESRWRTADDYAIRSMAATRATSKALRQPLGFVMQMAGFSPTPLEEIPPDEPAPEPAGKIPPEHRPTPEQAAEIVALVRTLAGVDPDTDWKQRCAELVGAPWDHTTTTMAASLIRQLQQQLEQALAADGASG